MANPRLIVVFARHPTPGRVKTRLIPAIGADAAAEVHRRCLAITLSAALGTPDADAMLAVDPDDADFAGLAPASVTIVPQGPGDLGAKLRRATDRAFQAGRSRVVVTGSDCPEMTTDDLAAAFSRLDESDVVIGPAADGGYYLLGLRRPAPALFQSIDWGTAVVAEQTRRRARDAGLSLAELDVRRDIDVYADLQALVAAHGPRDARLGGLVSYVAGLLNAGAGHV